MNNEQNERIKLCRYYRGDNPEPRSDRKRRTFWGIERLWVMKPERVRTLEADGVIYVKVGLEDFEKNDGTPLELKLRLFEYAAKHCGGGYLDYADDFRKLYKMYIENALYKQGE